MKGDIIQCLNCGKTFKDDTKQTDKVTEAGNMYQWQGQDSRTNNFKNMCPFCYGTQTKNLTKPTKKETKRSKKSITQKRGQRLNRKTKIVDNEEKMKYHRCKKCAQFHNQEKCPSCKCTEYKRIHCWCCGHRGIKLLDKFGCCKYCETNLVKYPIYDNHPYPEELFLNGEANRKLDEEVLGRREKFTIPDDNDQGDW